MNVAIAHLAHADSVDGGIVDSISFALEYSITVNKRSLTNEASSSTSSPRRALAEPEGPGVMDRADFHTADRAVAAPAASLICNIEELQLKISLVLSLGIPSSPRTLDAILVRAGKSGVPSI